MASKSAVVAVLVLRILALAASVVTVAVLGSDHFFYIRPVGFQDFITFRYVMAVAVISMAYGVVQLPFAVYYAVQDKRLVAAGWFPDFEFYGDQGISLLLATGTGAGIGVSYELKKNIDDYLNIAEAPDYDPFAEAPDYDLFRSKVNRYFEQATIASSFLTLACLCLAIISVISNMQNKRLSPQSGA